MVHVVGRVTVSVTILSWRGIVPGTGRASPYAGIFVSQWCASQKGVQRVKFLKLSLIEMNDSVNDKKY